MVKEMIWTGFSDLERQMISGKSVNFCENSFEKV